MAYAGEDKKNDYDILNPCFISLGNLAGKTES